VQGDGRGVEFGDFDAMQWIPDDSKCTLPFIPLYYYLCIICYLGIWPFIHSSHGSHHTNATVDTIDTSSSTSASVDLNPQRLQRMSSMGCSEEEQWRPSLYTNVPAPLEEDSDEEYEDQLEGEGLADIASGMGIDNPSGNTGNNGDGSNSSISKFVESVSELVATAYAETHQIAAVLMEIKSMKFAQNKVHIYF
jgi:hypothetical protein